MEESFQQKKCDTERFLGLALEVHGLSEPRAKLALTGDPVSIFARP